MTRIMGHTQRVIARRRAKMVLMDKMEARLNSVFVKTRRRLAAQLRQLKKADPVEDFYADWEGDFGSAVNDVFNEAIYSLGEIESRYYADHGIPVTYDPQAVLSSFEIGRDITKITDDTRAWVEGLIRDWYNTDQSTADLIDELATPFGPDRARLIAITETAAISSTVADEMMNAAGIDQWDWVTSGQDNVCPICLDLAANGPYTRRDPMPPEPSHPGCYCDAAPRLPELAALMGGE